MRKTAHATVGVISALAVTQPSSVSEVLCSLAGGIIGGLIVDIDLNHRTRSEDDEKESALTIYYCTMILIVLVTDYCIGKGISEYVINNLNYYMIAGGALFVICCICGYLTPHRSFTHSILGFILFTGSIWLSLRPIAIPFGIGYASHIIIDLPNKTGLALFYPIKKRFCFKWCSSNGKINTLLAQWGRCLSGALCGWFVINAIILHDDCKDILQQLRTTAYEHLNTFQVYLIFVNFVTILIFNLVYNYSKKRYLETMNGSFESNYIFLINIFPILGGGIGMLFSLLFRKQKLAKYNAYWYVITFAFIEVWTVAYFIVNPLNASLSTDLNRILFIAIIYLIIVNLLSIIVFVIGNNSYNPEWSTLETIEFILGLIGGSFGGLFATCITSRNNVAFLRGFSYLSASHAIVILYFICLSLSQK